MESWKQVTPEVMIKGQYALQEEKGEVMVYFHHHLLGTYGDWANAMASVVDVKPVKRFLNRRNWRETEAGWLKYGAYRIFPDFGEVGVYKANEDGLPMLALVGTIQEALEVVGIHEAFSS